jgi:hypothetical protein
MKTEKEIIQQAIETLKCDDAEIITANNSFFLMECNERYSEDQWFKLGRKSEPLNFHYMDRKVVASGSTLAKLKKSLEFYVKLSNASNIDGWIMILKKDGATEETINAWRKAHEDFEDITKNMVDLNPEFSKIIDENLEDLI